MWTTQKRRDCVISVSPERMKCIYTCIYFSCSPFSTLFSLSLTLYRSIMKNTIFLVESTHSCWHISDVYLYLCSGLHAVSSWACVSGGYPAAREDGPVEQNCFCLPGDKLPLSLTLSVSYFCLCVVVLCLSLMVVSSVSSDPSESWRQHYDIIWCLLWSSRRSCVCEVHQHSTQPPSLLFLIFQLFFPFFNLIIILDCGSKIK